MTLPTLASDLIRPDAYPVPRPASVELRESLLAWVFLTEADVYKVKKAIAARDAIGSRLRACEAEVARNERLAAGVYLGVTPVRLGADGRACMYGAGEVVDWAVHMLRLPDAARADVRLARGRLRADDVDRIAHDIAAFHSRCATDARIAAHGAVEAIAGNALASFEDVEGPDEDARAIERWQLDFVQRNVGRFDRRRSGGFVRDVHGDLRLEHVYLEEAPEVGSGITILDCIELADDLRWCDVACDLALLSMDLAAHERVDLAERLLGTYARASGDYELYGVVDFYESYRAYLRSRMAAAIARDARDPEVRARADADARRLCLFALACGRRPLVPPIVVGVGGAARARSRITDAVADRLAAPVVDAGDSEGGDVDALLRLADPVLASGRPVVIDAPFHTASLRASARELARRHRVAFLFVDSARPHDAVLREVAARAPTWPRGRVA